MLSPTGSADAQYRGRTALPYKRYDAVQFDRHRGASARWGCSAGSRRAVCRPTSALLAKEPTYYNWERDLDARLAADNATVVQVASNQTAHETIDADVALPEAAAFDTPEVDLSMQCPNHRDGERRVGLPQPPLGESPPRPTPTRASRTPDGGGPRWGLQPRGGPLITTTGARAAG